MERKHASKRPDVNGYIRILFTFSIFEASDRRIPRSQASSEGAHIGLLRGW
ncbi:MAG: hypothetical protein J6X49_07610 [Victivallales bacterium]|nr:hypothetical protein [Victivallales bacterium]